jgi:exopolyphosphatase/guanosine-5'-triphosphate,3'-diphosphate pyrophosphatase
MPEVVPRWEWRTFGERFGAAEDTFAALSPERVQETDELYLLSEGGGDTVKVRADLMDVKHLERVNDDGLEQWIPVKKAGFPLRRSTSARFSRRCMPTCRRSRVWPTRFRSC